MPNEHDLVEIETPQTACEEVVGLSEVEVGSIIMLEAGLSESLGFGSQLVVQAVFRQ